MRWLSSGLTAVLVSATFTFAFPSAPAAASNAGNFHTRASTPDTGTRQSVEVPCPRGEVVYGFGGSTRDAGGAAALVALYPNEALDAVTAVAEWRGVTPPAAAWSVVATASCRPPGSSGLVRVMGDVETLSGEVRCTGQKVLYAGGFAVSAILGSAYTASVVPDPDSRGLAVLAGGGVDALSLRARAIALCGNPPADQPGFHSARTTGTPVPVVSGVVTSATAPKPDIDHFGWNWVTGAGARSTKPGMFIEAIGPTPELDGAVARMSSVGGASTNRATGLDAGEDEVTAYTTAIGAWY